MTATDPAIQQPLTPPASEAQALDKTEQAASSSTVAEQPEKTKLKVTYDAHKISSTLNGSEQAHSFTPPTTPKVVATQTKSATISRG
jgi:hypothetical protein